jgi:hypothetical protein
MDKQWRYERKPWDGPHAHHEAEWSHWFNDFDTCLAMAENSQFSTGRIQERTKPTPNTIVIEKV